MVYKDYTRLKHIYSGDVEALESEIQQRKENSVVLPLVAKNGEALRYVKTPEIDSLLGEIKNVYEQVQVNPVNFVAEESLATCTIEGAMSTLPETVKLVQGKEPINKSEKMISNNIKAISTVLESGFEFTEDNILKLWKVISDDAVDNVSIQGEVYRNGKVVVADGLGNVYFEAPDHERVPGMMRELVDFCNSDNLGLDDYVKAIIIHYYFVYIHPFCDGNGRTARLLLQNWLIKSGLDKFKGISISSGVLKNKSMYYKSLQQSENAYNDITFSIIFYLETILDVLYEGCKGFGYGERHFEMSDSQRKAVTYLKKHKGSSITIDKYAEVYKVGTKVAGKELAELVDNKILDTRFGKNFCLEFFYK